jgi:hypothetical protein
MADPQEHLPALCIAEWSAYRRDSVITDRHPSMSPVLGAFCRAWNDALSDASRQSLNRFADRLLDTAESAGREMVRAELATSWVTQTAAAAVLDHQGLGVEAARLEALPRLDVSTTDQWRRVVARSRETAMNAAGDAMLTSERGNAARAAGWRATRESGVSAARAASEAALGVVTTDDARAGIDIAEVAEDAEAVFAWSASAIVAQHLGPGAEWEQASRRDIPGLETLLQQLQASALQLVDRLIPADGS